MAEDQETAEAETLLTEAEEDKKICGIDEAGRGCLAGPLVVAGVVLTKRIDGLNDSKKLTEKKREDLFEVIIKNSIYKIVWNDNETIDKIGLSKAIKNSLQSITSFFKEYHVIFDGNTNFGVRGITTLIKADSLIAEVSAASILAKVSRDRYMKEISKEFPLYNFQKHKGYGTKEHIELIKRYGYSKLHRKSFKLKNLSQPSLF